MNIGRQNRTGRPLHVRSGRVLPGLGALEARAFLHAFDQADDVRVVLYREAGGLGAAHTPESANTTMRLSPGNMVVNLYAMYPPTAMNAAVPRLSCPA